MFVIMIDPDGFRWYYAHGKDAHGNTITYRWDQTVKRRRDLWEIVPWVGY